jgi:hypothetical protein
MPWSSRPRRESGDDTQDIDADAEKQLFTGDLLR